MNRRSHRDYDGRGRPQVRCGPKRLLREDSVEAFADTNAAQYAALSERFQSVSADDDFDSDD